MIVQNFYSEMRVGIFMKFLWNGEVSEKGVT